MQMVQILMLKIKLLGKLHEMLESESTKFNITIFGLLLAAAAVPIFMVKKICKCIDIYYLSADHMTSF